MVKRTAVNKPNSNKWTNYLSGKYVPGIFVFVFALLLYANSITNNYNLDDELVTRNHKLTSQGFSGIGQIFASPYYTDNAGYSYEYRPMVLTSFAVEHQFFGDNPYVSHFINLLLYALCCLLLYRLLYLLLPAGNKLASLSIALLFVAFPAHTEVVCSIKNRDDIMSLLFGLLALYAGFKAVSTNKKWLVVLVPLFFMLALLSKNTIISFVVIIPLALLLLTDISYVLFIAISLLLLLPVLFAVDFVFWYKLCAAVILILALSVFYVLVRLKYTELIKPIKNLKNRLLAKSDFAQSGDNDPGLRGFKVLLTGINPGKEIVKAKSIIWAGLAAAFYFLGVETVFIPLVVASALVLGALITRGNESMRWWASVALFICLAFAPQQILMNGTLYNELVITFLVYQIFYGGRKLFIPATIVFILFYAIEYHPNDFHFLVNVLVAAIGVRIIGWPAIIWQMVPFYLLVRHWSENSTNLFSVLHNTRLGAFFILLLLISLIFRKGTSYLAGGLVVLAISIMFYFQAEQGKTLNLATARYKLVNEVNTINPRFIEIEQNRPLDFIEQPVSGHDAISVRLGTAFEVVGHYLVKTVVPYPMAFYYGFRFIKPMALNNLNPMVSLIICLLLALIAIVLIRKNKVLSLSLIIYLSSLAIISGYFYPVPGLVAERFMFIPDIGWCMFCGFVLFSNLKLNSKDLAAQWKGAPNVAKLFFATVLCLYSTITFARNFDWKDDLTLFRHDIDYVHESAQAQNLLATHLVDHSLLTGDPDEQRRLREEAVEHLKKAINIRPSFFNPTYDLGKIYLMLNMPDSALVWLLKANSLNPGYSEIRNQIADMYMQRGQFQLAIPQLEAVIQHRPDDYAGYNKLSYVYFMQKDYYKCIEISQQAILKTHAGGVPYNAIGSAYLGLNKPDSAAMWAHKALEIDPANQDAMRLLQRAGAK